MTSTASTYKSDPVLNVDWTIVDGPSRGKLFDACEYAYDEFDGYIVAARFKIRRVRPSGEVLYKKLHVVVTGLEHAGVRDVFYIKGDVSIPGSRIIERKEFLYNTDVTSKSKGSIALTHCPRNPQK